MVALLVAPLLAAALGAAPAGYVELEAVDGAGVITGRVRVAEVPAPRPGLPVHKDHDACGAEVPDETWVVAPGGAVANVLVELVGIEAGKKHGPKAATLTQEGCRFVPHALVVPAGTKLTLASADSVMHSVHAKLDDRTVFNVGMPSPAIQAKKKLRRPGLHALGCDAGHTWMSGWIFVSEHPYAVVTGADGAFRVDGVPPGTWKVRVWHEAAGEQVVEVTVVPGQTAQVDVEL